MASRVKRAPPTAHAAAGSCSRYKLWMATVSRPPSTNARVASHTYRSPVPHAKSRTSVATKCQVALDPDGENAAAASGPGVTTFTTRPLERASANLSRDRADNTSSGFWSTPVAPTGHPCGTVTRTS